jgi:excisionase family DNA binding protein
MAQHLSVTQVAQRLSVTPRTIQKWIADGQFPNAYKLNPSGINSPYRIPEKDVQQFEARRHGAN